MIKQHKGTMILTTVVMLLPVLVGLILWNRLPEQVPLHWNVAGEVDGWGSREMLVFYLPLLLIGLQWLAAFVTGLDPKNKGQTVKAMGLALWSCPLILLVLSTFCYVNAMGYDIQVQIVAPLCLGLLFIAIGNYLPKCKRNYTIGIKLPWTLSSDDNWNKTHRMAGKMWTLGGAAMVATAVFGNFIILFGILAVMALVPIVYSYLYYRKHESDQ